MRRGLLVFAVVALVAVMALWIVARLERSPLARSAGTPHVPEVVAGRDFGLSDERAGVRSEVAARYATVRCAYLGEDDPGTLTANGEEVIDAEVSGAELSLALPAGTWSLVWRSGDEAYLGGATRLGTLTVEPGQNYACRLDEPGWEFRGVVRNLDGRPVAGAEVWVCAEVAYTAEDGSFRGYSGSGPCTVTPVWRDGLLQRWGESASADAFTARALDLVVDDAPVAGMGISFYVGAEGVRVLAVHPDTPAEEAGVAEGDLIVAVNGTPTAGLDEQAFIALGTGSEGSRVELVLQHEGERETVSFLRERL